MRRTSVHWWPGDRDSTKDWTQWNERAFNVGVAGPFLKYAAETGATGDKGPNTHWVHGENIEIAVNI